MDKLRSIVLLSFLIVTCMWSANSYADFHLLELDYFDMKAARFDCNRDPMTPQYQCGDYVGRVATDFGIRLLEAGYWNNYIHTEGTEAQVKTVGWQWELGIHVTSTLDIFHEHHSRHVMEGQQPDAIDTEDGTRYTGRFPVEDSWGLRIKFFTNPNPRKHILGD